MLISISHCRKVQTKQSTFEQNKKKPKHQAGADLTTLIKGLNMT